MSPTTCPKCGRPVEAVPGEPVNFCTWCGCPVTSEAILEREEPERYGRLAAIVAGETQ